jgi:hypothetical protein
MTSLGRPPYSTLHKNCDANQNPLTGISAFPVTEYQLHKQNYRFAVRFMESRNPIAFIRINLFSVHPLNAAK